MEYNSKTYGTQKIKNDIDKNLYSFNHYLQREENQWNRKAKSLLIDSMLRGYIILPFVIDKRDKIGGIIEGKQRLSTLRDFLDNKLRMTNNMEPLVLDVVTVDEDGNTKDETKEFDISGKKFRQFDKELIDIITSYQFKFYEITDATDKEIVDNFIRLNAGKPLTNKQLRKTVASKEVSSEIASICNLPFMQDKLITKGQKKSAADIDAVIKTLLLISNKENGYEIKTFNVPDIQAFQIWYNDNQNEHVISQLTDAINELDKNIETISIKTTSIPFMLYAAYRTIEEDKDMTEFADKVKDFVTNYNNNTDYSALIKNGTSSNASIQARLDYWNELV